MPDPHVSIVIPAYNAAATIERAVASVIAQRVDMKQTIVVDDGSTDGTADLVTQTFGRRITVIRQANAGACAARNAGIAASYAPLIQFLDADDELAPGTLAARMAAATDRQQVVFSHVTHPDGTVFGRQSTEGLDDPVTFAVSSWVPTPAALLFREQIDAVGGFDATLPCSQERDFFLRLAIAGYRFRHVPGNAAIIHPQPHGVSSNLLRLYQTRRRVLGRAWESLPEPQRTARRRAAFAAALGRDVRMLSRLQHDAEATETLDLARTIDAGAAYAQLASRRSEQWIIRYGGLRLHRGLTRLKRAVLARRDAE